MRARTLFQPSPLPRDDAGLLVSALEEHLQAMSYSLQGVDRDKVTLAAAPTSATDTGLPGQVAYDSDYIYVCIATNTWKRAALSTW